MIMTFGFNVYKIYLYILSRTMESVFFSVPTGKYNGTPWTPSSLKTKQNEKKKKKKITAAGTTTTIETTKQNKTYKQKNK